MRPGNAIRSAAAAACGLLALLLAASTAAADVKGTITTTGGRRIQGMIRWQPASRVYNVTAGNMAMKVSAGDVADIRVEAPAQLRPAAQLVQSKQPARAIPVLEKLVKDYEMLQWDMEAARWLADAHIQLGDPGKAAMLCDRVIENNPRAAGHSGLAPVYWEALLQTEQFARLRKALGEGVQYGDRELAAVAQIKRGDIDRKEGEFREALVDGYLRTIVFFEQQKNVLPEAYYKAAKCFEELGEHSHAEKMRKKLLADYPQDPYTQKVKSGT